MFSFSTLAKTLKKYVKNISVTDEQFVDELLKPFTEVIGLRTPRGKAYFYDKSRASELINGKRDLPKKFRAQLGSSDLREGIEPGVSLFIERAMSDSRHDSLRKDIDSLIANSDNLEEAVKADLLDPSKSLASLLACCLLLSIELPNDTSAIKLLFQNGSYSIDVVVDDLFKYGFKRRMKQKRILVIPVNTQFSMTLTEMLEGQRKPLVSDKTVHGKFLRKWEQSGGCLDNLQERVFADLRSSGKEVDEYRIGTVAVVEERSTVLYLLAISSFDERNVARASRKDIKIALESLIQFYDENGQGYDLFLPLLGTGRSRANLSLQESFDLISKTIHNELHYIHGNIHIVVLPEDAEKIDFEERTVR